MAPAASASAARLTTVVVGLLLVWRIIEVNVAWYDDTGRPRVPSVDARGALSTAERKDSETAVLRRMLEDNPGEVAALLMLAREYESGGDAARAAQAYRTALELAPRDREVLSRAAVHFLRQEDPVGVAILAQLASHYPAAHASVFPVLAQVLVSASYREQWSEIVRRNPAWFGRFMVDSCRRGLDPSALMPTLLARTASRAATGEEVSCVIDALRSRDRWEEAYHLWLSVLPRERLASVGYVFNGSFEFPPGGGFDWVLQAAPEREAGHAADVMASRDGAGTRALRVVYNGKRQSGAPARQYLALAPGRYELSGMARPEGIKAVRGIVWVLRCVQAGLPAGIVGTSERFLGSSEWRRFRLEFEIGGACPGQVLQLEPVAEDGAVAFVTGTAWFDDLRIVLR